MFIVSGMTKFSFLRFYMSEKFVREVLSDGKFYCTNIILLLERNYSKNKLWSFIVVKKAVVAYARRGYVCGCPVQSNMKCYVVGMYLIFIVFLRIFSISFCPSSVVAET